MEETIPRSQDVIPAWMQLALGALLTMVAGFVDAVGYLELGGFFASFVSGASISFGVGVSEQHWSAVQHAASLIGVFVAGATVSSMISGMTRPWGLTTILLLEGACLSGALGMSSSGWTSAMSVLPVVAAMGVQNTALRPVNGIRLGVTFMTGTLVSLSQALGRFLIGQGRWWSWTPHALLWCSFVAGAGTGAGLHMRYGFVSLAAPTIMIGALALLAALAASAGPSRSALPDGAGVRGNDAAEPGARPLLAAPTTFKVKPMRALNALACSVALLIAAGEIARYWGNARFIPMALDELLVAGALLWAAWRSRTDGPGWHLAAWGAVCGLALVLLVQTADHQMHGPAKAAGPVYLAALGALLIAGLWAIRRTLQLVRSAEGR